MPHRHRAIAHEAGVAVARSAPARVRPVSLTRHSYSHDK
ncbi:hypothetical protein BURMUCF2_A0108 [Burkholderia multivorans CF2]|nr:hypothetical protein BURMUCF2_A0108 [Burkholderia multivorans CF2]